MDEKGQLKNNSFWRFCVEDRKARFLWREIKNKKVVLGLLLFLVFLFFLTVIQFSSPDLPGNDGYYHIKMAYLIRTEGLKPIFKWLPLTILNPREFYNHHFLFHIFMIPFTFGDLVIGAKWASVVFASLAFITVWRLLDDQEVLYAPFWALGVLVVSEAFIFRMSMPRAQSLSLGILLLAFHWMLKRKHKRLIFLGFLYVWFYNAFPLLLMVAGSYVLGLWMTERKLNLQPLLFSSLGITAGLILNPYFPYNMIFIVQHIVPKIFNSTAISVGSEWYPYTTQQLLSNSPFAFVLLIIGILALGLTARKMRTNTATGLILSLIFAFMLFQSRRFIEYFPPFALIFSAFSISPIISDSRSKFKKSNGEKKSRWIVCVIKAYPAIIMIIALVFMGYFTMRDARKSLQGSKSHTLYSGASEWLEKNTDEDERVFQTDWDDFTRLFFYNTHNTYLVGLDPTYMQFYNDDLYSVWVEISRGKIIKPSRVIESQFGAKYVMSDLQHEAFIAAAEDDLDMIMVYRDEESVIFKIVGQE